MLRRVLVTILIVVSASAIYLVVSLYIRRDKLIDGSHWPTSTAPSAMARDNGADFEEVSFGGTVYHLPVKKYRIWVQQYDRTRDHAAFGFSTILPDLSPATSDPDEVATWGKGKGWRKEMPILVEYGWNFITQAEAIENAFNDSKRMKKLQDDDENEGKEVSRFTYLDKNIYTELQNGCRRYDGHSIAADVIQICGQGETLTVIECALGTPKHRLPSPSCKVMFNLTDKTQVTYSYGYNYFELAPEIHKKLVALLNSFRKVPGPARDQTGQHPARN